MSIASLLDGYGPVTAHHVGDDVVATMHGVPVAVSEDGDAVRVRHDVGLAWSGEPDVAALERRATAVTLAGPGLLDAHVAAGGERLTVSHWVPGDTGVHGLAVAVRDLVATVGAIAAQAEELGVSLVPDADDATDSADVDETAVAADSSATGDGAEGGDDEPWGATATGAAAGTATSGSWGAVGRTDDDAGEQDEVDDVPSWDVDAADDDADTDDEVAFGAAATPVPGEGHDEPAADDLPADGSTADDPWDLSDLDDGAADAPTTSDEVPTHIDGPAALRGDDPTGDADATRTDDGAGAWAPTAGATTDEAATGTDDDWGSEADAATTSHDDQAGEATPADDGDAAVDGADEDEDAAEDAGATDTVWGYVHEAIDVRGLTDTDTVVGQLVPGQWYAILQTGNGWAHVVSADGSLEGWADDRRIVRNS